MIKVFQRLIDLHPEPVHVDAGLLKDHSVSRRFFLIGTAAFVATTQLPPVLIPRVAQVSLAGERRIRDIHMVVSGVHTEARPVRMLLYHSKSEQPRLSLSMSSLGMLFWSAVAAEDIITIEEGDALMLVLEMPVEGLNINLSSDIAGRWCSETLDYIAGRFHASRPIPLSLT